MIGLDLLRRSGGVGEVDRVGLDGDVLCPAAQRNAMLLQLGQDPHPADQQQALAQPRRGIDHGDGAAPFVQEFGQLDPDQFPADDHHVLPQRHPGPGGVADEIEVCRDPGGGANSGCKARHQPGLAP